LLYRRASPSIALPYVVNRKRESSLSGDKELPCRAAIRGYRESAGIASFTGLAGA
jgi:hypothetical protein